MSKKKKSDKTYDSNLKERLKEYIESLDEEYKCDVCGTKKESDLTIHHILRKSIKSDNSTRNLAVLCREDHDLVEYFYDWIIPFNVPHLWHQRKKITEIKSRIISIINGLLNNNAGKPSEKSYIKLGFGQDFIKLEEKKKIVLLEKIRNECDRDFDKINKKINKVILKSIDWDFLYLNSVDYVINKKRKENGKNWN